MPTIYVDPTGLVFPVGGKPIWPQPEGYPTPIGGPEDVPGYESPTRCSGEDSCEELARKADLFREAIRIHRSWDRTYHPGRHAQEIDDLGRGLANCMSLYGSKDPPCNNRKKKKQQRNRQSDECPSNDWPFNDWMTPRGMDPSLSPFDFLPIIFTPGANIGIGIGVGTPPKTIPQVVHPLKKAA